MPVNLIYRHQERAYELMKKALEEQGRAAYVFPVGCGKSFPVLKYIEENPDKRVLYVSPNIEIINQIKKYISNYILNGEGVNKNTMPNFRAVTYQKIALTRDIADIHPDIIVFDEIHRMGAEKWEQGIDSLIEANPSAKIIGMSATPERTDKRNMAYERFGEDVVYEMSLTDALSGQKEGEVVLKGARYVRVLSELKGYASELREAIELTKDENRRQRLIEKFERLNAILIDAPGLSHMMEQAMTKKNGKYIVFCTDRQEMFDKMSHAKEIFGQVNRNINVDYVISNDDVRGKTQKENRETVEDFETRENGDALNLLFCVDMLNEGRHIEGIDGEVQFRPTDSSILYKQQIGRVLSADKRAEETVIIDVVNNWLRQIDTFNELEQAIRSNGEKSSYDLFKFTSDEIELVGLLQEIGEELKYNSNQTYHEILNWLETHDGQMPRPAIRKNGLQYTVGNMTEEERDEVNLYARWRVSADRRALEACKGIPLNELPSEYQEYRNHIAKLREYGLGIKTKTAYEEIIEWLDTHDGNLPRAGFRKNGRALTTGELTDEERYEKNLSGKWMRLKEKKALEDCMRNRIR